MTAVLLHTLAWTGVLIAAVLVLRRPVARHFGPEAAYALWALPLFRLILPPVTLPAWMAPPPAVAPEPATAIAEAPLPADAMIWQAATPASAGAVPAPFTVPMENAAPAGFDLLALLGDWPVIETLLLVWLAGASVVLWRRFAAYFSLRRVLLAHGREVGRAKGLLGKVRLVETPATNAPLALGVLAPVIALPPGFLALHDRAARDLALAHELAHHRGGDLLVNIVVQPLFALHWWNPLGRYGWLALRRDQEAACDARVMARRSAQERAAYAALIARFAAAPGAPHNAALTAPMACPVLGEKSIIHRLRSLAMSDLSPRRRLAGRALLGAGLLALPLTASISYAASEAAEVAADGAGLAIAAPPAPPAPPSPPGAPDAPEPLLPPEAPEPPQPPTVVVIEREGEGEGKQQRVQAMVRSPGHREFAETWLDGAGTMDKAEREEMVAALREGLAEAERVRAEMPAIIAEAMAAAGAARAAAPRVMMLKECNSAFKGEAEIVNGKDGRQTVMICQPRIAASARLGLEQARAEIARDRDIPEVTRKQLLKTLDSQIARWKEGEG